MTQPPPPYRPPAANNVLCPRFVSALLWLVVCLLAGCSTATIPRSAELGSRAAGLTPPRAKEPTLDDFWDGNARFELEIIDTGLPMGESDTIILEDGTWRSYLHASDQSLGVFDQCGAPVDFPGCLVTFTSVDHGRTFTVTLDDSGDDSGDTSGAPVCQLACIRCPCDSRRDHIDQQQYPRIARFAANATNAQHDTWLMTYEYRANTFLRRSDDGLNWSSPQEVPHTGIWRNWLMNCPPAASIGAHPFAPATFDCLVGSPPGIYIDHHAEPPTLYILVGLGQNPSSMGCYRGPLYAPPSLLRPCEHNPLFTGATDYGPQVVANLTTNLTTNLTANLTTNTAANAHFDFRTISSADLVPVGPRHYLFYEGVRGPGPGDHGDTQFLLGLARSVGEAIDGEWELFAGNPVLIDLPGNVGVGHADIVLADGATYLYTSLDGITRSRLRLVWE